MYLFCPTFRKIWMFNFATLCLGLKRSEFFSTLSESDHDPDQGVLCSGVLVAWAWQGEGRGVYALSTLFPLCQQKLVFKKPCSTWKMCFFAACVPSSTSSCGCVSGLSWCGRGCPRWAPIWVLKTGQGCIACCRLCFWNRKVTVRGEIEPPQQ